MPTYRVKGVFKDRITDGVAQVRDIVTQAIPDTLIRRWLSVWVYDPDTDSTLAEIEVHTPELLSAITGWFDANHAALAALVSGRVTVSVCSHDDAEVIPDTDPRSQFAEVLFG
jgi:hypothetical protein